MYNSATVHLTYIQKKAVRQNTCQTAFFNLGISLLKQDNSSSFLFAPEYTFDVTGSYHL